MASKFCNYVSAPNAPQSAAIQMVNSSCIQLNWTTPIGGNNVVDNYRVRNDKCQSLMLNIVTVIQNENLKFKNLSKCAYSFFITIQTPLLRNIELTLIANNCRRQISED